MKIENVITECFDLNYCKAVASKNEKDTGNRTFVKHLGPENSHPTINYQKYIVVEIVDIPESNQK